MKYLVTLALLSLAAGCATEPPIVIAHRGASGYLPEHTLEAYALAIEQGADYIEPDLVMTRDGVLIARHEHYLSASTDIASRPAFADRRRTHGDRSDWFTEDFTLEEIRQLRAIQAFPGRSRRHDGEYRIPTFEEVIDLVQKRSAETGREIGLYPEAKVPAHFASLGYDFRRRLIEVLDAKGLNRRGANVFIQSFEPAFLEELDEVTEVPLIMLVRPVSDEEMSTPDVPLEEIARFADGIGALKWLLIDADRASSGVIEEAKARGLLVHAWTFRDDAWPETLFDSPAAEIRHFIELGVDGFFTDFPDTGVSVRNAVAD